MNWIKRRAVEPSTWKGAGWLLLAIGVWPVGAVEWGEEVGAALVGLGEVIRREKE